MICRAPQTAPASPSGASGNGVAATGDNSAACRDAASRCCATNAGGVAYSWTSRDGGVSRALFIGGPGFERWIEGGQRGRGCATASATRSSNSGQTGCSGVTGYERPNSTAKGPRLLAPPSHRACKWSELPASRLSGMSCKVARRAPLHRCDSRRDDHQELGKVWHGRCNHPALTSALPHTQQWCDRPNRIVLETLQ